MTTTTAYQTATAAPLSQRAERREDARLRADLEIQRKAAAADERRKDEHSWSEERRKHRADKAARKAEARRERAKANQGRRKWLHDHTVDLLFVPVIGVPGGLAWDAMAAYGTSVWGPLGVMLPLFSEGAMWAYDFAIAIRRRRDPDAPVWHLRLGLAIFAGYGAALNFLHGLAPTTTHHGLIIAASMALVSVAGVTAHQLIEAGPRRSRAERELARFRREAERRQASARKAAARRSLIEIDEEGHADLVYEPGVYRLKSGPVGPRLAAPKDRPAPAPRRTPAPAWTPAKAAGMVYDPPAQAARAATTRAAALAGEPPAFPHDPAIRMPSSPQTLWEDAASGAGVPQPAFYGPATSRPDPGPDGEDSSAAAALAGWPKEAVAERLATEIRAAADAGTVWKPDYDQLMALTDKSLRTCQTIVSIARRLAGAPEKDDLETSHGRPATNPGRSRTAALSRAGAA